MIEKVAFTLNGLPVELDGAGDEPLLHVLRNRLGLRATRFGCGAESCGACMVSVDGQARFACTLPLSGVGGRTVATAESLPDDPTGAVLLAAFAEEHVGQCGYCLSGILMSAFTLLKALPGPSRDQIVAALEPHLCRCGAHGGILAAVERASAALVEAGR